MKPMKLVEIAEAINARLLQGDGETICYQVSTDTRNINNWDMFIALKGDNFDAHDFLEKAVQSGAAAIVVSREPVLKNLEIPVLLVADTTRALQDLANYNRKQFDIPVVAVTGSNGKTSTKDIIASILGVKYKTLKTTGNFNNHIGLPLTLLELDDTYQAAVVEMGMRGIGEIDELTRIAEPTCAVITIIGESHLELLGSVENIAKAKGEILDYIDRDKFAVLNGNDPWQRKMSQRCQGQVVYFGINEELEISASAIQTTAAGTEFEVSTPIGSQRMIIPVLGEHNVLNALAGITVGIKLGLNLKEIEKGLLDLKMTSMRLEVVESGDKIIINDTYNASPSSMKSALKTLKELSGTGKSIAILGNMFELGERTISGHEEVGHYLAELKIDYLITVGDYAENIAAGALKHGLSSAHIYKCENNKSAVAEIEKILSKGDIVLVKGSRGMKMEEIVQKLSK